MERKTLNLREWMSRDTDERWELLKQGYTLDDTSCRVMNWAEAFRNHGSYIPDAALLRVYELVVG